MYLTGTDCAGSRMWLQALASSPHVVVHAIATQMAPVRSGGITSIETSRFALRCFQTRTGIKFVLSADRGAPSLDALLRMVYELYTDYVLKNPFSEPEQPIHAQLFTHHVTQLFESMHETGTPAKAKHEYFTQIRTGR